MSFELTPLAYAVNQRLSAEHGPFEGPSSYPRLCRWSLIYVLFGVENIGTAMFFDFDSDPDSDFDWFSQHEIPLS